MRAVLPESQPARPDTLAPALPTRAKKMLLARWLSGFSYYASAILTFSPLPPISSSSGIEKLVFSSRRLQEDVYDSNLDSTSD